MRKESFFENIVGEMHPNFGAIQYRQTHLFRRHQGLKWHLKSDFGERTCAPPRIADVSSVAEKGHRTPDQGADKRGDCTILHIFTLRIGY
jgi:hypothetical protein